MLYVASLPTPMDPGETVARSVVPVAPATLMATRSAPGASPVYWPPEDAPLPAMRPATKVPCPYCRCKGCPPLRSTPSTRRPAKSGRWSMPVSRTATVTPGRVTGRGQGAGAGGLGKRRTAAPAGPTRRWPSARHRDVGRHGDAGQGGQDAGEDGTDARLDAMMKENWLRTLPPTSSTAETGAQGAGSGDDNCFIAKQTGGRAGEGLATSAPAPTSNEVVPAKNRLPRSHLQSPPGGVARPLGTAHGLDAPP